MTIRDGIKFGIGFVIGKALVGATATTLLACLPKWAKGPSDSEQTENEDVEDE